MTRKTEPLEIGGRVVQVGERLRVDLPLPRLQTRSPVHLPVDVVRGERPGPVLFVCAAIHGDELNGVEVVRRLLREPALEELSGTLLAIPVVNVYGFLRGSRTLPDRRDPNRAFPGSRSGSLADRLCHRFVSEVVAHATHGIDLHSGSIHKTNLPQIRACLDDAETATLARAFGAPVILDARLRDGSLRRVCRERGLPLLVYEGGEALRFDEFAIEAALRGVLRVLAALGMVRRDDAPSGPAPRIAGSSTWARAPASGILCDAAPLGADVDDDGLLGVVTDPFGGRGTDVRAARGGILIGRTNLPIVHEGDALFHVAHVDRSESSSRSPFDSSGQASMPPRSS